jgi:hypothetical protein
MEGKREIMEERKKGSGRKEGELRGGGLGVL